MDKTFKRDTRIVQLKSPWPVSVSLYTDELLSSWLIRNALANGCDPMSLTSYLWGSWRLWATDFDRTISAERLETLARTFTCSVSTIQKTTLKEVASKFHSQPLTQKEMWPWMLSIGSRNRNRKGGLQYCPDCFKGTDPYFKKGWRSVWHTCCPQHGLTLLDKCENCRLPLEPHKLEALWHLFTNCPNCGFELQSAQAQPLTKNAALFQHDTDSITGSNTHNYHGHIINACDWYKLSTFFIQLVKRITKRNHLRLLKFAELIKLPIENIAHHSAAIENMTTKERVNILSSVQHLISIKPSELLTSLLECNVSQQAFSPKNVVIPNCLITISQQLPYTAYGAKNNPYSKPILPAPRPNHEVERRAISIIRSLNK